MKKYSNFDIIKTILISTVGSGVINGIDEINKGTNSPLSINLALLITTIIIILFAQCYSELNLVKPKGGGDFVYISSGLSKRMGIFYLLLTTFFFIPGVLSYLIGVILKEVKIPNNSFYSYLIIFLVIALIAIPIKYRKTLTYFLNIIQMFSLFSLGLLLIIVYKYNDNEESFFMNNIKTPVEVQEVLISVSKMLIFFCGYYDCNFLPGEMLPDLSLPYLIGDLTIFLIYFYFFNIFMFISKKSIKTDLVENLVFIKNRRICNFLSKYFLLVFNVIPLFGVIFTFSNLSLQILRIYEIKKKYFLFLILLFYLILFLIFIFNLNSYILMGLSTFVFFISFLSFISLYKIKKRENKGKLPFIFIYISISIAFFFFLFSLKILLKV